MLQWILRCVGAWLCLGALVAQDFEAGLAQSQAKIDAKEWRAALDLLLPLQEKVEIDEDRELLAERLGEVGDQLVAAADFEAALRARNAELAARRSLHGDREDLDVARCLNNVAYCLDSLGRADGALPQYEQALAMLKRLHGDRDHPDVAANLNNVAGCLSSLGRASEALPQYEQVLAMAERLFGDRDHPRVATTLNNLASCLSSLGRAGEALPHYERALAMRQRLYGDRDHPNVATTLSGVAGCLQSLGRADEALPQFAQALAMRQRLYGDRDHADVAQGLNNVAHCLQDLGREGAALPLHEQALAMRKRMSGDRDHPAVATSLTNVAACLQALGRAGEALPQFEQALAMDKRLYGNRDHRAVGTSLNNLAVCLKLQGRAGEALLYYEQVLAMWKRLYGDGDHPDVAKGLNNLAGCLDSLGRAGAALPLHEQALAMGRRLYGDGDHPDVAQGLHNVAACLNSLGRAGEALPHYEQALAMRKRLFGDRDHPAVAASLNNVAVCLESLGRPDEALLRVEEGLAMRKRLFGDRDHPEVALSTNNLAACLESLGRAGEALPRYEQALAMMRRLYGDLDHPEVAATLNNVATALKSLGRVGEAVSRYEQALAMQKRLYGDRDHPNVARGLNAVAACLESLGRAGEALPQSEAAMAMIERLRDETRLSPELRQSLFEDLKSGSAFEQLQRLANQVGRPMDAMHAAERSRGRGLLDQLEQFADPEIEAERRARLRGDEAGATRIGVLRHDLEAAHAESDRLLHELTRLAEEADVPDRESRREALLVQSNTNSTRLRQLLDERARLLGDVLPVGRVRPPSDIQSILQPEELLLEFTVTRDVAMLYVLARERAVEVLDLPNAFATTQRLLPALLQRSSRAQLRGRDPEPVAAPATATDASNTELFASLIPASVWDRVRKSRRVFVAAHRELHRVPFELLVTSMKDDKPAYWLDEGPPISYVPSGTVLHWLRQRAKEAADDQSSLDLLAVGDPRALDAEPLVPEQGVFVVKVNDGGEGARIGLQPGDVLTSYDGQSLADDKTLRDVVPVVEAAIEDKKRDASPIELEVWRRGAMVKVAARPGKLGIEVGVGRARAAYEASLGNAAWLERITRTGDLERLDTLPPLLGARAETEAIEKVFADKKAKTKRLLSADATEPAVFDLAAKAKYLHFACHGIAEEYAGQSLSMLVLSPPPHVLPADDGLLKLADLWNTWRGRLSSCRLVVLSACRTNVGATQRDEAPQALPLGFFFAGVPSVISSLWAVDDQSTRDLMTDFYGRLLAGETDKLKAFTDAKKALRAKHPDPFHWAPFLFLGAPE